MTEDSKRKGATNRGFASMAPEVHREIARKGGRSVPSEKRSFSQNHELAAEAGRKGGASVSPAKRSFSKNHQLASEAGTKGGQNHGASRPKQQPVTKPDGNVP